MVCAYVFFKIVLGFTFLLSVRRAGCKGGVSSPLYRDLENSMNRLHTDYGVECYQDAQTAETATSDVQHSGAL